MQRQMRRNHPPNEQVWRSAQVGQLVTPIVRMAGCSLQMGQTVSKPFEMGYMASYGSAYRRQY
ncbi:hypothetical protein GN958_ATG13299 [Phytophthora infestans]|uniref:Uncharacterized protein n=1 Tax=Phytophthora infestans TaxID=4787 RepID=A0A8S9U9F7_PHYIN|nr:hypothetical protein GN958_ATG13299 [Phytophthora infestans]